MTMRAAVTFTNMKDGAVASLAFVVDSSGLEAASKALDELRKSAAVAAVKAKRMEAQIAVQSQEIQTLRDRLGYDRHAWNLVRNPGDSIMAKGKMPKYLAAKAKAAAAASKPAGKKAVPFKKGGGRRGK